MKVLADTSVWIDHFRRGEPQLVELLRLGEIVIHSAVIGELACGSLRRRDQILLELGRLPRLPELDLEEALRSVEQEKLWGRGLGWTDVILLGSCRLAGARLWTKDRALGTAARDLIRFPLPE